MNIFNHLRTGTIWALDQSAHKTMASLGRIFDTLPIRTEDFEKFCAAQKAKLRSVKGNVAVMPVHGVIEQHVSPMSYYFGGASCEDIAEALDQHMANPNVAAIVMHCDTPGGSSYGVEELSDMIYSARPKKPLVSVCDSLMASAGYWIGSSCERVMMTPGGDVGSVGVYMMHVDYSQALADDGVKVEFIKAGKYKTEGNPYEPLSQDGRDYMQEMVDETYTKFTKAVARNRGTDAKDVRDNYGQGRTMGAEAARKAGMIDRIADFPKVLSELVGSGGAAAKIVTQASAEVLRLRHEARRRAAHRQAGSGGPGVPSNPPGGSGEGVEGTWSAPNLADFTDKSWGDLSTDERRKISQYFGWRDSLDSFGDLKLPHHFFSGDKEPKASLDAVRNALARLDQVKGLTDNDRAAIKGHLEAHMPKSKD